MTLYIPQPPLDRLPATQLNQSWHETRDRLNILWLNQHDIVYHWHETSILFPKHRSVLMQSQLHTNHHPIFVYNIGS